MAFLRSVGFNILNIYLSILVYRSKKQNNILIVYVYIDEFWLVSKHRMIIDQMKKSFQREYNIKNTEKIKIIISSKITRYEKILRIN